MKRVAINGVGRVGRLLLRRHLQSRSEQFQIVAVNDPIPVDNLIYLLKYDSVHGPMPYTVKASEKRLSLGDWSVPLYCETDPEKLPWQKLEVDLVIDASGHFNKHDQAMRHIDAGAKRVLLGAPCADADITVVLGVNESDIDLRQHRIISNASCTTNSLAPPLKLLDACFGVERVLATTVHAYTVSQNIVDSAASRKHRGRAGAINIIPTSTGADAATALVLPQLKGRISAMALRVPVPDGALTDICVELSMPTTAAAINRVFMEAAEGTMKGILAYSDEELVSSDIIDNSHSAIIHGLSTCVVQNTLAKIYAWYDNEFGYACRCLDLADYIFSS